MNAPPPANWTTKKTGYYVSGSSHLLIFFVWCDRGVGQIKNTLSEHTEHAPDAPGPAFMTSDIYESDDAWKHSPPLVAIKPNYGVEEKRPPFVPPGSPNATENDAAKGTPGRSQPSRPDIAYYEREHPLGQDWSPAPRDFNPADDRKAKPELETTAKAAVDQLRDNKDSLLDVLAGSTAFPPPNPLSVTLPPPAPSVRSPSRPRLPSISAAISAPSTRRPSEDLLALSPPYTDSSVRHSPEDRVSLPALQSLHSPPQSNPATSPNGNNRVLPSIRTLGVNPPEFPPRVNGIPPYPYPGPSSAGSRNDPAQERFPPPQHIPPSPFSHFSPTSTKDISNNPSPASMPTFWRTYPSQTELHPSGASPYDPSPITAKSPAAGYPTPTEQPGAGPGDRTSFDSTLSPNGNAPPGNYKCHHPGCTAPPFQTQYLLNSHANVHSQDRPHFCPVENCPRAIGGKGFKRKNEMMRHGLVHNSPGYVCPFCLDQQHKYPRPDNLQRYVIQLPRVIRFMLILYQDTFESIMSTRAKTIPSCEMYSRSGPQAVHEADDDG
ncbi:hypothetical protein N7510_010675 [Penicillium lagena]|uniref:uncharacterized protein n=1 Tax=Penicillium lagena TaxID=94218 RepID=UPI002541E41A|nr:uncharacterized protein N7510_010675 [Penicillium lagena]KAJ5601141.1 hypothetical protein N7510_010675 [Penicillium lagena]